MPNIVPTTDSKRLILNHAQCSTTLHVLTLALALPLLLGACGGTGNANQASTTQTSPPTNNAPSATTALKVMEYITPYAMIYNYAGADINGDGLEDVVVSGWMAIGPGYQGPVNPGSGAWQGHYNPKAMVKVLLQQPDGRLQDVTSQWLSDDNIWGSNRVLISDLDGDGRNDIVLPGFQDTGDFAPVPSVVLWNEGDHFTRDNSTLAQPVWAHGACLVDVDRDGRMDLIMGTGNGGVWRNLGARRFAYDNTVINNAGASCASDGDSTTGRQIVVSGNNYSNDGMRDNIYLLSSSGTLLSSFGLNGTDVALQTDDTGMLFVDIDADGLKDLIVTGIGYGRRRAYKNTGNWNFTDYSRQWLQSVDTQSYNQITTRSLQSGTDRFVFLSGGQADTVFALSPQGLQPIRSTRFVDVARQVASDNGFSYSPDAYQSGFVYQSSALGGIGLLAPVSMNNVNCQTTAYITNCQVTYFYSASY